MATFPTLSQGPDSRFYGHTPENVAEVDETEGGYEFSRPRHTRLPRADFKTGYTDLSEEDRQLLLTFWNEVRGSSDSFSWVDPVTANVYTVRFAKDYRYGFQYKGAGGNHRWDLPDIMLREV